MAQAAGLLERCPGSERWAMSGKAVQLPHGQTWQVHHAWPDWSAPLHGSMSRGHTQLRAQPYARSHSLSHPQTAARTTPEAEEVAQAGSACAGRLQGSQGLSRLVSRGLRDDHHRGQGVPLADGAQGLALTQPLVDALHMEAVLAGQYPQLVAIPALHGAVRIEGLCDDGGLTVSSSGMWPAC